MALDHVIVTIKKNSAENPPSSRFVILCPSLSVILSGSEGSEFSAQDRLREESRTGRSISAPKLLRNGRLVYVQRLCRCCEAQVPCNAHKNPDLVQSHKPGNGGLSMIPSLA